MPLLWWRKPWQEARGQTSASCPPCPMPCCCLSLPVVAPSTPCSLPPTPCPLFLCLTPAPASGHLCASHLFPAACPPNCCSSLCLYLFPIPGLSTSCPPGHVPTTPSSPAPYLPKPCLHPTPCPPTFSCSSAHPKQPAGPSPVQPGRSHSSSQPCWFRTGESRARAEGGEGASGKGRGGVQGPGLPPPPRSLAKLAISAWDRWFRTSFSPRPRVNSRAEPLTAPGWYSNAR